MNRQSYKQYLKTPKWRALRRKVFERDDFQCRFCQGVFHPSQLECHHLTYARMGRERLSDLETLCGRCHSLRHNAAPRARKSKKIHSGRARELLPDQVFSAEEIESRQRIHNRITRNRVRRTRKQKDESL